MSDLFMDMHHGHLNRAAAAAPATHQPTHDAPQSPDEQEDAFANVLNLKLKKPKHWKWELSTSRSCTNIAIPRILLYDHKGVLLVDADSHVEQTYTPQDDTLANAAGRRKRSSSKAASASLEPSIRRALDAEFNGLQIQEATPTPERTTQTVVSSVPSAASIDFYTNELPDYKSERGSNSNSSKGVRFKVDDSKDSGTNSFHIADLPTPPSTTTTTTTNTNSTGSGPREKRRYRRSRSSGRSSESILERFSFNKGRYSSPEYAEEHDVYQAPRYYLATSKAGTLVVQKESFSRYRRRHKPKESSMENVNYSLRSSECTGSQRYLLSPELHPTHDNGTELRKRLKKRVLPVRRYRSDATVLLQRQWSTTSDEEQLQHRAHQNQHHQHRQSSARGDRNYASFRRQHKADLLTIPPDPPILSSATAR